MKLTNNFSKSEFDSKDGAEMPSDVLENVKKLAGYLQILRDHLGKMVQQGYKERDTLEKKGLIKVSTAEKENREKRQQKRKWV